MKKLKQIFTLFLVTITLFSCQSRSDKLKSICENHILNNYVNDPSGFEVTSFSLSKVYKYDLNTYSNNYVDGLYEVLKKLDNNFSSTEGNFKEKLHDKVFVEKMYKRLKKNKSFELTFEEFYFNINLNLTDPLNIFALLSVDKSLIINNILYQMHLNNESDEKIDIVWQGFLEINRKVPLPPDTNKKELKPGESFSSSKIDSHKSLKDLVKFYKNKNNKVFETIDKRTIEEALLVKYPELGSTKTPKREKTTINFYKYHIITRQKINGDLQLVKYDFLFNENYKMLSMYEK